MRCLAEAMNRGEKRGKSIGCMHVSLQPLEVSYNIGKEKGIYKIGQWKTW